MRTVTHDTGGVLCCTSRTVTHTSSAFLRGLTLLCLRCCPRRVCVCMCVFVLLAYIRADEFKMLYVCVCVCVRTIAAQRQTSCEQLLYGNECRPSFAPSRICIGGFSFQSVLADSCTDRCVLSLCASYPFCFTDSRVKRFFISSPPQKIL